MSRPVFGKRPRQLRRLLLLGLAVALLAGCRKNRELEELGLSEEQARQILAKLEAQKAASSSSAEKLPPPPAPKGTAEGKARSQQVDPALTRDAWIADGLVDLAPAAQSVAHRRGAFLVDGENRLWFAKRGALGRSSKPMESRIRPVPDNVGRFPLGRAPTIAGGHAYWVVSHYLLRRPIQYPFEPLETIAEDARIGTRASAIEIKRPNGERQVWVAYIALPTVKNGPLRAKLWSGTKGHQLLTPVSSSALTVQLVPAGRGALAVSLEARTGMSTVHTRWVLPGKKSPRLEEDRIVWVGGSAQPMTELHALRLSGGRLLGLMPLEQDITHYGMAVLNLPPPPGDAKATERWLPYHNGLTPAPVDSAKLCGQHHVLYARPSTARPGSPQELVLAPIVDGFPEDGAVLSTSRAFYDVSIATLPGGALLTYVADHRTWARTIRCKKLKK